MTITAISRDWGIDPCIVRIVTDDDLAAITTAGYLLDEAADIRAINHGDFQWVDTDYVLISYDGGIGFFTRDAVNNTFVAGALIPGSLADTLPSGDLFVGSAGNVATAVAMSGDATISNAGVLSIANNVVDTANLALNTIQYVQVPLTTAQIKTLHDTPVQILPAAAANTAYVIDRIWVSFTFVSAQYTGGGALGLEWANTAALAGAAASNTIAGATINAYAASNAFDLTPDGTDTLANIAAAPVYISNGTANFATGDSTMRVNVAYRVVATA